MSDPGNGQAPSGSPSSAVGDVLQRARERTSRFRSGEGLLEVLTVIALAGGGLLILAEFLNLFQIETRDLVVSKQVGGSHHAYAMLVVGAATIGAALLARSTEQWPPALGIALLGGFALAFALIGDLPDATRSDLVRGAQLADAHPTIGFWTELVGAIVTLVSGLALVRVLRRLSS